MKFIIDKSGMIIRCVWMLLDLSNEIRYKNMIVLVIRKRGDCDNYEIKKQSKKSDWPDFWNNKKK